MIFMADEIKEQPKTDEVQVAAAPKRVAKRRAAKKVDKTIVVKAKRKTTVARAYIKPGKGEIRINGQDINTLESQAAKDLIMEAIVISDLARDSLKKVNIQINIYGGGVSSQIQAARGVLAKGLVEFSKSDALKREYLNYDRSLLIDDTRRVEPKKFKGPKARARFQTSYR
jgi:small subunit ribosomal protein S9